jgi:hypothetical protein
MGLSVYPSERGRLQLSQADRNGHPDDDKARAGPPRISRNVVVSCSGTRSRRFRSYPSPRVYIVDSLRLYKHSVFPLLSSLM